MLEERIRKIVGERKKLLVKKTMLHSNRIIDIRLKEKH